MSPSLQVLISEKLVVFKNRSFWTVFQLGLLDTFAPSCLQFEGDGHFHRSEIANFRLNTSVLLSF